MFAKPHCPVIAIEEHYWDEELAKTYTGSRSRPAGRAAQAAARFHRHPHRGNGRGRHRRAGDLARRAVDAEAAGRNRRRAHRAASTTGCTQAIAGHKQRFAAFAALPTAVPEAAADELERTTQELGFKGAMLHGLANGVFLDDKRFWPIYARAEKLDVPIYLHPAHPHPDVQRIYYDDYVKDFPMVARPAWGYTVETATIAIRLVLSGVFERHPKLKIILGHLGETLPFLVWRIDQALKRPGQKSMSFRDIFCRQFLHHHERQFFQSGAALLRDGNGRRSYPVRGRLAVRHEPAGDGMDAYRAALRRRQNQDPLRQRQGAAAHLGLFTFCSTKRLAAAPKSDVRKNRRAIGRTLRQAGAADFILSMTRPAVYGSFAREKICNLKETVGWACASKT